VRAFLAAGAVALVLGASAIAAPPKFLGTELSGAAPNFTLRDQNGKVVKLSALHGKPVLVTFLYTHCPDVCPLIATHLDTASRQLARVRVLAVSVDPARDTRAAVKSFVRGRELSPKFSFLVGTRAQLSKVWAAYHIAVQPGPKKTVTHSAYTFLVDAKGQERVLFDAQVKPAQVVHDVRALG
jgi:protein SCO1/2